LHQFPAPPDPPLPPGPTARPKHQRRPLAAARTTSGIYAAANWVNDRHVRTQARRARVLTAAVKLGLYLLPEAAARLAAVPAELRAPVHPSQIPYLEITTKTPGGGGSDVPGRCAAGAFAAPRVRAAVAAARLAKREVLAARRAARMVKHDKDPMPMERLPGAGLGACAAGIAAAPVHGHGAPFEGSDTNSMNSGTGGGTAGADAILAALLNRAARRRWKSLQRRAHPPPRAIG
jgi:hypothetical protein